MSLASLSHVLETCLYVRNMQISRTWYKSILKLTPTLATDRMTVFPLGQTSLLLFQLGQTAADGVNESNASLVVPGHGPSQDILKTLIAEKSELKQHYCIAVESTQAVTDWEAHLKQNDVSIRGHMRWPGGGTSVYFAVRIASINSGFADVARRTPMGILARLQVAEFGQIGDHLCDWVGIDGNL